MIAIAAVDRNWAIGCKGRLLNSIPDDMKFFRKTTTGHVVVMGRKTLESFPNGKPLRNRTNIVITRNRAYQVPGAVIAHSKEEALDILRQYEGEEIYVIGGESIYKAFLPYCEKAYITYMDFPYQADAYFPNLDKDPEWKMIKESEEQSYFDILYTFREYEHTFPI